MDNHTLQQVIDLAVKTAVLKAKKEAILECRPVGSYFLTETEDDPNVLFGGKWEQVKGRFIFACDSSHPAGTTGGEASHQLTVDEFPQHTHKVAVFTGGDGDAGDYYTSYFSPDGRSASTSTENAKLWHIWKSGANKTWGINNDFSGTGDPAGNALPTGGNQPHNNMPPYIAAYCWKRVK